MTDAFKYRPKFVDIRVKKAGAKAQAAGPEKPQPAEHACDHIGCKLPGAHRAPKGRDRANEFWHFCLEHVTEYNKRWNYFSGMSDAELAEYRAKEEVGHRPTWTFRGGKGDRLAAAARGFKKGQKFDVFGADDDDAPVAAPKRRLSRLQVMALDVLSLDQNADAATIRAKYAEQVKRWHPDSNGGDRTAETRLQKVVQAYQTLKQGGLV